MSDRLNHHFVPQFHLRLMADGRSHLSLVRRRDGLVVPTAGIRGQCARHKYYGDAKLETELSRLEGRHASAYRAARDHAWAGGPALTVLQKYRLREGLVLQRNRTPRRALLAVSSMSQFTTHAFKAHVASLPKTPDTLEILKALESGQVTVGPKELFAVALGIQSAIETVPLTMDLSLHLLRNQTALPFVLGDSPCVFSNHYKRDITDLGVSGVVSRGLMIAMPIDPRTQVLLLDSAVYHPALPPVFDLEDPKDVETLNVLQVYESMDCVYFASMEDVDYVRETVLSHPAPPADGVGGFGVVNATDALGTRLAGELTHIYEPAPPVTLNLSFLTTDQRPASENLIEPRSRELLAKFDPPRPHTAVGPRLPTRTFF